MFASLLMIVNRFSQQSEKVPVQLSPDMRLINHPDISRNRLRQMYADSFPTGGWKEVQAFVQAIQPRFFRSLALALPFLETGERQLCTLIYFGRSTKEMAQIMGVNPGFIRYARTKLRNRLKVPTQLSLYQGLQMILIQAEEIPNLRLAA